MRLTDVYAPPVFREPERMMPFNSETSGDDSPQREGGDNSSLRILLVVESSAGGTGRHVLDLADGLVRRGHVVHLAHSTIRIDHLFLNRLAKIAGVTRHPLPMRTVPHLSDFRMVRALRKLQSEHGPFDIIHGHSSKGGALARLAALGSRSKAFYTLHGMNSMDAGLSRWKCHLFIAIERTLSVFTHGIITVSPEEARAAANVGLNWAPTRTIPNGLDALELTSRETARRTMGVKESELVVGFVGRLVVQKAPELLVEAFAKVSAAIPNARLAIVGDGPLQGQALALSQQLNIADKIIWLGARDAREVLAGFDLFALSSRKEGLPYVILEAMCAGLPIVATSSSGVEILIEPGVNGTVVPPNDPAALAQAITYLLKRPGLFAKFGAASQRMIKNFTIDGMVEKTLDFYRSSLRSPKNVVCDVADTSDEPEVAAV